MEAEAGRGPLRVLAILEDTLLVVLLTVMMVLAVVQILLRNLFDAGLTWADPLLRVIVLWLALAGALAATRADNHINLDVVSRLLPAPARAATRALTDLFAAAVCGVLAYHGARLVQMDWLAGTAAFGAVPAWLCELIIPLGFALMGLRFVLLARLRLGQVGRPAP